MRTFHGGHRIGPRPVTGLKPGLPAGTPTHTLVLLPRRTAANLWRPVVLVVALLAGWWAVTEAELVAPYILPSPGDTWQAAQQNAAYLAQNTWVTTWETVIGFIIATVVGIFVAVMMIYSSSFEKTVYPLILFAQVIPKIAIAPLFIVWLGFGPSPKILVAVLMAFFPIVISGLADCVQWTPRYWSSPRPWEPASSGPS